MYILPQGHCLHSCGLCYFSFIYSVLLCCILHAFFFCFISCRVDELQPDSPKTEKKSEQKSSAAIESGVVYDSATLKKSVKDKISMFRGGDSDSVGRSNSIKDDKRGAPPPIAPKSSSLPRDAKPPTKSASLPKDASPADLHAIDQGGESSLVLFLQHWNNLTVLTIFILILNLKKAVVVW